MTTWTNISGGSAISQSLADQAATSATNAATSATDASNSATSASTSATAAEAAKTAAQASETASAASETASAASEAAAASSETAAAASESAAAASETAAAGSATSASSSATSASTSASGAATSATNAATSESNAATSESNASTSASSAATSATAAAGSATSAANSASSAAADLATFRGQYHGASATAPTTGLDTGDLYFDTVANAMKVYDGSSWVAAYISSAGTLAAANNLSDVSSASASRTNLGVAIGVDVQAYDAGLNDIAGLAVTDGNFVVGNGANWVAESGATARTSLGLGTMATQAANSVAITGGSISGITDLALADGGTGASTASAARTNLGLGTMATAAAADYLALAGGTMTGDLVLAGDPDAALKAATKQYVDSNAGISAGKSIALAIVFGG